MNAPVRGGRAAHASPTARLAEYEVELGAIATDAAELADELCRLRSHASDLAEALSDRDRSIGEQQRANASLREELARVRGSASDASAALRSAQARIEDLGHETDALSRANHELRVDLTKRERLLEEAKTASGTAADTLAAHERMLMHEISARHHAALEAERLQRRVATLERLLEEALAASSASDGPAAGEEMHTEPVRGHVRLVALTQGYRIVESPDECPAVGHLVEVGGCSFVVVRTGRSPLPGDGRPCAFLSTG